MWEQGRGSSCTKEAGEMQGIWIQLRCAFRCLTFFHSIWILLDWHWSYQSIKTCVGTRKRKQLQKGSRRAGLLDSIAVCISLLNLLQQHFDTTWLTLIIPKPIKTCVGTRKRKQLQKRSRRAGLLDSIVVCISLLNLLLDWRWPYQNLSKHVWAQGRGSSCKKEAGEMQGFWIQSWCAFRCLTFYSTAFRYYLIDMTIAIYQNMCGNKEEEAAAKKKQARCRAFGFNCGVRFVA